MANVEKVGTVISTEFGILSPEQILRNSFCEIYQHITTEKNKEGTLMDPRLGPTDRGVECVTCGYTYKDCPGHFGHYVLPKPVIQIQHYKTVVKLLNCICGKCSTVRLLDDWKKIVMGRSGKGRLNRLAEFNGSSTKNKYCQNCGAVMPKYTEDPSSGTAKIVATYPVEDKDSDEEKIKEPISPEIVLQIFKNMTDDDVRVCGLDPKKSHPAWMIWTIVPIPPPSVRPSVTADNGKKSDDDLTYKYNDIIKVGNDLKLTLSRESGEMIEGQTKTITEKPSDPIAVQRKIDEKWNLLQYHCATLINNATNSIARSTHRSGRPLKTFKDRISGKYGDFRSHLMGKRTDYSGRSVITAGPDLALDQIGIPKIMCMNITFPEIVTQYNIRELTQMVINGPKKYPGAKCYQQANQPYKTNLKMLNETDRRNIKLKNGDIVHRHLIENDWVLGNRQPSLYKMSIMAHRIVPTNDKTISLNLGATTPYNADFDGDEYNIYGVISYLALAEISVLACVSSQFLTPQTSGPIIGLIQDALLGHYLLTKNPKATGVRRMTYHQVMSILAWIGKTSYTGSLPAPEIVEQDDNGEPVYYWTSYQILSMVMPKIFYNQKGVSISSGQITSGTLDKKLLGVVNNSLFHISFNDYGQDTTRIFFDNMTNIANIHLLHRGFSVGIGDCVPVPNLRGNVSQKIAESLDKVDQLINNVQLGLTIEGTTLAPDPQLVHDQFPSTVVGVLNSARRDIENMIKDQLATEDNAVQSMVSAGSKGKFSNLTQIMGCLGQQEIDGTWIQNAFDGRTLPHFPKHSLNPMAHGFIANSFYSGLTPVEYWFHAKAGRGGVISKSIATAETGYIQRRLVKVEEDVMVAPDGTVRNSNGHIIQFSYGNDGFDATFHERQRLPWINWSEYQLRKEFHFSDPDFAGVVMTPEDFAKFKESDMSPLDEEFNILQEALRRASAITGEEVSCPINFQRLIAMTQTNFSLDRDFYYTDLSPLDVVKEVAKLRQQFIVVENTTINDSALTILQALVACYLSSKQIVCKWRLTKAAFTHLLNKIHQQFLRSIINPGENVGIVSAQSIGEPTTQMNLEAIHSAGIGQGASVLKVQGVPRLKEILSLTKKPKTPSVHIALHEHLFDNTGANGGESASSDDRIKSNFSWCSIIGSKFEHSCLRDLVTKTEIYYTPEDDLECLPDGNLVKMYKSMFKTPAMRNQGNWLIRIEFNREAIMNKHIPMRMIANRMKESLDRIGYQCNIVISDDNDYQLIARVNIVSDEQSDLLYYLKMVEKALLDTSIRGIQGIQQCLPMKEKRDLILNDGSKVTILDQRYEELSRVYHNQRYYLETSAPTNLAEIGNDYLVEILNQPEVDRINTISNNVWDVYRHYGIMAARACLIKEFNEVLEANDSHISIRHIELLIDIMTTRGILVSVDRHGMNRNESGVWHRASFEVTTAQIDNAVTYSEIDNMSGISANITFGQLVRSGTNSFQVVVDNNKLKTQKVPKENLVKREQKRILVLDKNQAQSGFCDNIDINFNWDV